MKTQQDFYSIFDKINFTNWDDLKQYIYEELEKEGYTLYSDFEGTFDEFHTWYSGCNDSRIDFIDFGFIVENENGDREEWSLPIRILSIGIGIPEENEYDRYIEIIQTTGGINHFEGK